MSKDRKEIYIGESLRKVLAGRKGSLTTVVNLIADRYLGMIERTNPGTTVREDDVYRAVLAEYRHPLEAADIAGFPARVKDWMARNPMDKDEAHYTAALTGVQMLSFIDLVAPIDRLERQ